MKFTEEYVMSTERHFLVNKFFANRLKMCLLQQTWVETHWFSSKEKVPGTAFNKEADADSLLGHERTYHYWFPWEKNETINSACFLLPTS